MTQTATNEHLATLIRDLRKHKNLTLGELAEQIGRSVGFLSQVERGLSQTTVADLYAGDTRRERDWVTRPNDRRTLYYAGGVTDILASPNMSGGFSMLDSILAPGATSGEGHLDDSSEQGGFVLEGELTIWYEDDTVTLYPNDSFQLPPHSQFRYGNLTDKPTRVLWIFT